MGNNPEFVIVEQGEINDQMEKVGDVDYFIFHKNDLGIEEAGILVKVEPNPFPLHDHLAEDFIQRIEDGILTGELFVPYSLEREVEIYGLPTKFELKKYADNYFGFKIKTGYSTTSFNFEVERMEERFVTEKKYLPYAKEMLGEMS